MQRVMALLAWCVTVIISQCSAEPVQCVPDITCEACTELARQLYDHVNDKRAEIFSQKILENRNIETATKRINEIAENPVEQDSKGQCGSECKTCRQVSRCFNNEVAEYLYINKPDRFSFIKFICKDFTEVCKKGDWKQRLKKGVADAGKKFKTKVNDASQKLKRAFKGTKEWFSKSNKDEHEL